MNEEVKRIDVGVVTAFAEAKRAATPYPYDREKFRQDLANLGTTAAEVEANRQEVADNTQAVADDKADVEADKASVEQSAAAAAQSAENAHTDALAATAAKEAAETAKGIAVEAKEAAASSKTGAENARTEADTSAEAAAGSALVAGEAAQTAAAAAQSASGSAAAAAQSAEAAAESARTLTIDTTLTQAGQAADAKKVGDKITDLKSAVDDISDDINYTSVTQGISKEVVGLTITNDSDGLVIYGTCTATRYIGFLNGNSFTKATSDQFTKTLSAGTYLLDFQQSGSQLTGSIRGTYTKFDDPFPVITGSDGEPHSGTYTFTSDVMLAYNAVKNRDYGTSEEPTYITFRAYKITADDETARARLNGLTTNPSSAIMSAISSASITGITVTRLSDTRFKLSGSPTSGHSRLYNLINGVKEYGGTTDDVYTPNILTPGTYTLRFKTSYYSSNQFFLIVPQGGGWNDRRYLSDGANFTVEENAPVALIIYGGASYDYTNELIIDFWLEREEYEIKADSAVDVYGRMLINDLAENETVKQSAERNALLSAAIGNSSYAVDGNGHELFKNGGSMNAYKKAMQCVNITWTNTAAIPDRKTNPDIQPGTHTGMIYSSVKETEKYVYLDVSLTTFMTAMHNPYSLLYTEDVDKDVNRSAYGFTYHGVNCGAYYGIVCSVLVGYSTGWGVRWETADFDYLRRQGILVLIPDNSADSVQRFDVMWEDGHTRLVTDITRDKYGIPSSIIVSESSGLAHSNTYTKNGFNNYIINHDCKLYRYVDMYKNTSYTPSPFVAVLNEVPETYVYNDDICTFAGDYAAFRQGQTIHINYAKGNYTDMVIASDGTVIQTISLPESYNATHSIDITSYNLAAGLYTAYLTDGTNNSDPTHFEIIDTTTTVEGTLSNMTVNFNKNANPYYLMVAGIEGGSHGKYILTESDISAGQVTLNFVGIASEMYGETYASNNYLRCIYQGQYGRVINDPIQIN